MRRRYWLLILGLTVAGMVFATCWLGNEHVGRAFGRVLEGQEDSGRKNQALEDLLAKGAEAKGAILEIALNPQTEIDKRLRAVEWLGQHTDRGDSTRVASLLQPHNALALRLAVGKTINRTGCSPACVRIVLHYLERIWRGDRASEDRFRSNTSELDRTGLLKEELLAYVLSTLQKEKSSTLGVLESIYGLGSTTPSPFAVYVVDEINLKEACGDMTIPFVGMPPDDVVRSSLDRTVRRLCKQE